MHNSFRREEANGLVEQHMGMPLTSQNIPQEGPPKPGSNCSICLEPLRENVSFIPCGHIFHKHCICRSLDFRGRCPICRCRFSLDEIFHIELESQTPLNMYYVAEGDVQAAEVRRKKKQQMRESKRGTKNIDLQFIKSFGVEVPNVSNMNNITTVNKLRDLKLGEEKKSRGSVIPNIKGIKRGKRTLREDESHLVLKERAIWEKRMKDVIENYVSEIKLQKVLADREKEAVQKWKEKVEEMEKDLAAQKTQNSELAVKLKSSDESQLELEGQLSKFRHNLSEANEHLQKEEFSNKMLRCVIGSAKNSEEKITMEWLGDIESSEITSEEKLMKLKEGCISLIYQNNQNSKVICDYKNRSNSLEEIQQKIDKKLLSLQDHIHKYMKNKSNEYNELTNLTREFDALIPKKSILANHTSNAKLLLQEIRKQKR